MFPYYRNQSTDLKCKSIDWFLFDGNIGLNPFQLNVPFHIETSHLIYSANQLTGFYIRFNTGLKCVASVRSNISTVNHMFKVGKKEE